MGSFPDSLTIQQATLSRGLSAVCSMETSEVQPISFPDSARWQSVLVNQPRDTKTTLRVFQGLIWQTLKGLLIRQTLKALIRQALKGLIRQAGP